jgi:hypothetical protein
MPKREVAELACRILAVAILALSVFQIIVVPVQIVIGLYDLMRGYRNTSTGFTLIGGSVSAVLHLALVCFLWTRSGWIASKIVPDDIGESHWPRIRTKDFQVAAFSTVGVVMFIYGIGYFCRSLGIYLDSLYSPLLGRGLTFITWLTLEWTLASLAYIALGLWLIVGSRNIVRFIRRMRKPDFHEDDGGTGNESTDIGTEGSNQSISAAATGRETA